MKIHLQKLDMGKNSKSGSENKSVTSEDKILIIKEDDMNYTTHHSEAKFILDDTAKSELEDSIEIDEKFIVEELPTNLSAQNSCPSFEVASVSCENLTGMKKQEPSHVKKEELTDEPKNVNLDGDNETIVIGETLLKQTYCCPICKMTVSTGSLLSTHIESEHANLSASDPSEYPAIAEFF